MVHGAKSTSYRSLSGSHSLSPAIILMPSIHTGSRLSNWSGTLLSPFLSVRSCFVAYVPFENGAVHVLKHVSGSFYLATKRKNNLGLSCIWAPKALQKKSPRPWVGREGRRRKKCLP